MDGNGGLIERTTIEQEQAYSKLLEYLLDERLQPMVESRMMGLDQRVDGLIIGLSSRINSLDTDLKKLSGRFDTWMTTNVDWEMNSMRGELLKLTDGMRLLEQSVFPKPEDYLEATSA
jgi:hypothetical protein